MSIKEFQDGGGVGGSFLHQTGNKAKLGNIHPELPIKDQLKRSF